MEKSDFALSFGELNLSQLRVCGHQSADGSLKVEINLHSLTVDDRRKGTKVSRLLDKKDVSPNDSFFYMLYEQKPGGEKNSKKHKLHFYFKNVT